MAFGGVLLINLILTIIMALIVPGSICIITGIVFTLIHFIRKISGKPRKKWLFITSVILITAGIIALIPFFILLLISA